MRTFTKDVHIEYLKSQEIPFVTVGSTNYQGVIQVDNDHKSACRELISILLLKGMKKIGLIGGIQSHVVTQSRLQGYIEVYKTAGLPLDKNIIYINVEKDILIEQGVERLLANGVDCIACLDDAVCIQVLNKLRRENIQVPEQMRVASFYDSTVLENNLPSVTSLAFDARELGNVACKTLLEAVEGKQTDSRTLLGYEVVLKESTK